MPRTIFEQELTTLQDDLLVMGSMVEKALAKAMDALRNRDMQAAREVVRDDDIIDDKQAEIEDRCIHVIATQTPVAGTFGICWPFCTSVQSWSGWPTTPRGSAR